VTAEAVFEGLQALAAVATVVALLIAVATLREAKREREEDRDARRDERNARREEERERHFGQLERIAVLVGDIQDAAMYGRTTDRVGRQGQLKALLAGVRLKAELPECTELAGIEENDEADAQAKRALEEIEAVFEAA
jgi:FtsZ-binding cell division protein ZapB